MDSNYPYQTGMPDFRAIAKKFEHKLKHIKVLAFDVDGILTTGHIIYDGKELGFNRVTHIRDGYGLRMMMRAGFEVGVISGGQSIGIKKRFIENLKLSFVYLGSEDKRDGYNQLIQRGYKHEQILYMGDEFFDIPLLKRSGFSATVATASHEIQEAADYVTFTPAGMGCVREVIDLVRYVQGIVPEIPDFEEEP